MRNPGWTRWLKTVLIALIIADLVALGAVAGPAKSPPPDDIADAASPTPAVAAPSATPQAAVQAAVEMATPTEVVIGMTVEPATALPIATRTATPTPVPVPSQTPRPTATLAVGPIIVPTREVDDIDIPLTATTGISSTDLVTITAIPDPAQPVERSPGMVNIALLGVDTRPLQRTKLSDIIVIANLNPRTNVVTMLSIPRDTLAYIPGYRSHKLNVAYNHGGAELFKRTIDYNFGINIDYVVAVNFQGVVDAVDTLGGIDVVATCPLYQVFPKDPFYISEPSSPFTVTRPYTDTFTGEVWQPGQAMPTMTIDIPQPGVYALDGLQALGYSRARLGVLGGETDRGHRVQQVIRAMVAKAKQAGFITRVPALYQQFRKNAETDLTLQNVVNLANLALRINDGDVRTRYFEDIGLTQYTLPETGFIWTFDRAKVHDFLEETFNPSPNTRPNDGILVEVQNGTGQADFGAVAAARLQELGFRVAGVTQAGRAYAETTVVDFGTSGKGSAIPYMQRSFGLKPQNVISQPTPGSAARYRIIVGRDFNPCYKRAAGPG